MLEVFRSRKMASLVLLGFSSGFPLYLTSRTLQAWMTREHVDLRMIGLFSLVGLPYSLKFLWAPFLDRYSIPFLGRRKGWIALSQLALALAIGFMAFRNPASHLRFFAANALLIAFFSATQDINIDAYRADILEPHESGAGAGILVLGYRLAMIATGAVALILADHWGWPAVYLLLGGVMILLLLASTAVPKLPALKEQPPQTLTEAVRLPFQEFFFREGTLKAVLILAFIILYRMSDLLISNMTTPFLLQIGFTQTDIGAMQGGVGLVATIVGILVGGAIMSRIGMTRSLWIFGLLQAVSNLAYMFLANMEKSYTAMAGTIVVENICTGLGTAALIGFITTLCNPRFSATQYALLSSLIAVARDIIAAPAGSIAQSTGWPLFFMLSFVAAVPGMILLASLQSTRMVSKERG
jgi:PAT family beta-lactamase induction signal transducer AmpG